MAAAAPAPGPRPIGGAASGRRNWFRFWPMRAGPIPDLAAAAARLLQADARARAAGAEICCPRLAASAGLSADRRSDLSGAGGRSGRTSTSVGLSASYELDFWGANRAAADSAGDQCGAISRLDQETVALTVTANVANGYFQLLSLRDRIRTRGGKSGAGRAGDGRG